MRRCSLRSRFMLATIGLLLLTGSLFLLYIHTTLKASLSVELQKRGVAIADSFSWMATEPSLTENHVALQLLALDFKRNDGDLAYLFIVDEGGRVITHTFSDGFPEELLKVNPLAAGKLHAIKRFRSELGDVFDIAVPMLTGELGVAHIGLSAEPILLDVRRTLLGATVMVALLILLSSAGAYIMARTLTRPLQELTMSAEALGTGDLTRRVAAAGNDEIAALGKAFNTMAQRLEATTVSRDSVEELNRQLAASNRELESFSYSVSHDLRSPLRHMVRYSRVILEDHGAGLDTEAIRYLERIEQAGTRMGNLIDSLLQLSRISRTDLNLQQVDLSSLARGIVDELQSEAPQRQVCWDIQEGITAVADPVLVHTMLHNLLENAWKYSRDVSPARIAFSAELLDGKTVYRVSDNGAGFEPSYADKLFTPFHRLHGAEFEGTGVGLATVQRIIHRHGGEIRAEATPGMGAVFSFTLR